MYLFVYGTLKKGHGNHRVLGDAEYIGDAELWGYRMFTLGGFPGISPSEGKSFSVVIGEVYKIEDRHLPNLDGLEGYYPENHSGMYLREKVNIHYKHDDNRDEETEVFVYVWNRDVPPEDSDRWIKDGVWR